MERMMARKEISVKKYVVRLSGEELERGHESCPIGVSTEPGTKKPIVSILSARGCAWVSDEEADYADSRYSA
jgi:hypothetical protein